MQVRLLRVLQERVYEPLGGTASMEADVRILAATHRDLREQVRLGAFREDLFYRVHVVALDIPPLRDRKEDIPLLADRILARIGRVQGGPSRSVSPEALALLMAHDYPGNVRELENILEYASVLCGPDGVIRPACLPDPLRGPSGAGVAPLAMSAALQNLEAQVILDAIHRNNGNRQAAARELGMHKSTLYRKAKALGLELPGA
jgi:transcriptional regulator with PAS, ATPase and Fis domain